MNEIKKLDEFQTDALKEVGSIGAGNATTSLSNMLDTRISISLHSLKFVPLIYISDMIKLEDTVVAVIQQLKGNINGYLLFMMSRESADFLVKSMLGEVSVGKTYNEMEESVLKELGNIMSGKYVTAISDFLGMSIMTTPPSQVYDMADSIINQVVGLMSAETEDVLFLRTEFNIETEKMFGKMLIFTDPASLSKILDAVNRLVAEDTKA